MVSCDIYKNTVHHRMVNTLRQYFFQEAWWNIWCFILPRRLGCPVHQSKAAHSPVTMPSVTSCCSQLPPLAPPQKGRWKIMKLKIMENGFLELLFRKQLSGSKVGFFQARMSGETDSFCQDYWVECIIQWITRWRRRMPAYQSNITRHQS